MHKVLPAPAVESAAWGAFVDGVSAAGPHGIPPICITSEGLILDGERRWRAARQLQWPEIGCIIRLEWETGAIIEGSLLGHRELTKGGKVFLLLGIVREVVESAEKRRLSNLKRGTKTLEKPLNIPKGTECASGKGWDGLAERWGVSVRLVKQALQIRKVFELPSVAAHRFEFQDGSQQTLREHFEPLILDPESPMGLGEVLKGLGWFVGPDGKPLSHGPPGRNTGLFYWERAWGKWAQQCSRWAGLGEAERGRAVEIVVEAARVVPEEVLGMAAKAFGDERKRRRKAERRARGKTDGKSQMANSKRQTEGPSE